MSINGSVARRLANRFLDAGKFGASISGIGIAVEQLVGLQMGRGQSTTDIGHRYG